MASNMVVAPGPARGGARGLSPFLSVRRVRRAVPGDLFFVAVAYREQHRLGVVQVAAILAVVLDDPRLDDRVDRAGFLAEAAENALDEVDVVARRAPRSILALLRLDVDGKGRADRLAQLARNAALLAVRVAAQRMQPAEARAHRRLLLRELHRDLAREQVLAGQGHAAEQFQQQERAEEFDHAVHRGLTSTGSTASASRRR